jgi:hypothetical protein
MGLVSGLRSIANSLGIIQVVKAGNGGSAPAKLQTRSVTLGELMSEVRQADVQALAEAPAELTVPLAKVCETAGVKPPPHGWTVDRLRELLRSAKFTPLARDAAQRALLEQFASDKVTVEDIVKDGIARDQAIDAFEKFVHGKMESRKLARQRQIASLQSQIESLQGEAAVEAAQWKQWLDQKRAYEKDMAWAIGYLLDRPVITTQE